MHKTQQNEAPRTSIIMPVYGTEATVVRAIESVRSQSDADFELIIVNDCSPDNARAVILEHLDSCKDDRIRFIENDTNLTLPGARNAGIREARGEWLAFLDSDDAYRPNFLERMHEATSADVDIVVCAHTVVGPDAKPKRDRLKGEAGIYSGSEAQELLLIDRLSQYAWDKIFRRSAVEGAEFPIINRLEDAAYAVKVFGMARNVRVIEDALHLYTVNEKSITWSSVPPMSESVKFLDYLREVLRSQRSPRDIEPGLSICLINTYVNAGHAALRLLKDDDQALYMKDVRKKLGFKPIVRTVPVRPTLAIAAMLMKSAPRVYGWLYALYARKQYGVV
ncbi:glycosyltransferase family 2 protein [Dermabacter vaginalis]|uniref:glycosyltransferase family 2 protein n=1 Tax=Dermabacter vaginalis TaxID=1630135 RepID=UPI001EF6803B|nr:glycosyltransferase family 2 protein [Dermabacter vaginalis]MCG7443990.1 glycosyltransferase [Dermabacter vaginalis]